MNWRKLGEIVALSVFLFVLLPFAVRAFGGSFTEGVLMGTGIAIGWYTLETRDLRRETSNLRREAASQSALALEQIEIGIEQNQLARNQAETAIRPLLISRIEQLSDFGGHTQSHQFVVRNIGHGPALFVKIEVFTVEFPQKGPWRVRVFPLDLVEPNSVGIPKVEFHRLEGQGQVPGYMELVDALTPEPTGHAKYRSKVTISYQDVQGRQFESLMEMGLEGAKLLSHRTM